MKQNEIEEQEQQEQPQEQQATELDEKIQAWFNHVQRVLQEQFEDYEVAGQIAKHEVYDYLFFYQLIKEDKVFQCGFFLNELVKRFQSNNNPELWISSFFMDLVQTNVSQPLPAQPESDEDARKILDGQILPLIVKNMQEEFPEGSVEYAIGMHPDMGLVIESGFPAIKEGNNTCVIPLQYLMMLYMFNRDPSEPVMQALDTLYEGYPQE